MPKFRLEMGHSEPCWFSGGRALVCPGGGLLFWHSPQLFGRRFPRHPPPRPPGRGWSEGSEIATGPASCVLTKWAGSPPTDNSAGRQNRNTQPRFPKTSKFWKLLTHSKDTAAEIERNMRFHGLGWWDTGPTALEQYISLSWDGPCVSTSQRTRIRKGFPNQSSSGRLPDSLVLTQHPCGFASWGGGVEAYWLSTCTTKLYYLTGMKFPLICVKEKKRKACLCHVVRANFSPISRLSLSAGRNSRVI